MRTLADIDERIKNGYVNACGEVGLRGASYLIGDVERLRKMITAKASSRDALVEALEKCVTPAAQKLEIPHLRLWEINDIIRAALAAAKEGGE